MKFPKVQLLPKRVILSAKNSDCRKTNKMSLGKIWHKRYKNRAGRGCSRLLSQHFGRLRRVDHEVKRSRPSWSTWWNPVSTKIRKISWAWWRTPVIPATQEAEAGRLLEPRRLKLWSAVIAPLHSSLGGKVRPCLKEKKIEFAEKQVRRNLQTR